MADRDTSGLGAGTGGPNRKASDPMGRDRDSNQQPTAGNADTNQSSQFGSSQSNSGRSNIGNELNRMVDETREHGVQGGIGAAQGRIRSLLEQQSQRAADQLGSVADALHKAAEQLSDENNGTAAHYADQAAGRVEQVADLLRNSTMDDVVSQVERFARRQPEVFVGAAFAVGFLFARFLKSSGEARFQGAASSRVTSHAGSYTGGYGERSMSGRGQSDRGQSDRGMAGGLASSAMANRSADASSAQRTGTVSMGAAGSASTRPTTNTATAATTAARTRDAAQLMAGGSPESTPAGTGSIGAAKPNQGRTDVGTGDVSLGSTPATGAKPQVAGIKPQGTLP